MARRTESPPAAVTDRTAQPPTIEALRSGTWQVVPEASTARFTVRDKVLATVHGTLPVVCGAVTLGPAGLVTRARVELDAAAVDTGNPRRDRDLARPRLLDTGVHRSVVVTTGPSAPGPLEWEVSATLSARGAHCPLTLRARPVAEEAAGVRVEVRGRFDRTGLGMTVPSFVIGRYLDLDVDLLLTPRP